MSPESAGEVRRGPDGQVILELPDVDWSSVGIMPKQLWVNGNGVAWVCDLEKGEIWRQLEGQDAVLVRRLR